MADPTYLFFPGAINNMAKNENGTTHTVGGKYAVRLPDGILFTVPGCPVADGHGPCSNTCGGNVEGSRVSTQTLTDAVAAGIIIPDNLGCQPLTDSAAKGRQEILFQAKSIPIDIPVSENV
jgi:hypothetical protein